VTDWERSYEEYVAIDNEGMAKLLHFLFTDNTDSGFTMQAIPCDTKFHFISLKYFSTTVFG
jgi:hypothetical protein